MQIVDVVESKYYEQCDFTVCKVDLALLFSLEKIGESILYMLKSKYY